MGGLANMLGGRQMSDLSPAERQVYLEKQRMENIGSGQPLENNPVTPWVQEIQNQVQAGTQNPAPADSSLLAPLVTMLAPLFMSAAAQPQAAPTAIPEPSAPPSTGIGLGNRGDLDAATARQEQQRKEDERKRREAAGG